MRISDWSSDVCSSDLMIQPSALAAFEDAAGAGDSHAIAEQLDIECGILGADAAVARLDREGAARSSDGHERLAADQRSEERRVGKECVRQGRSRWVTYHYKKTQLQTKRINNNN